MITKMGTQIGILTFLTLYMYGFAQDISFFNADGVFSIGTQSNRTALMTIFDTDQDGDLDVLVANSRH